MKVQLTDVLYHILQRLCREFGGYLVKNDNSTENEWLHSQRIDSKF